MSGVETKSINTWFLFFCIAIIHCDQNLLAPNLTAAAHDILEGNKDSGIEDSLEWQTERDKKLGGGLAFGLFLVGAPAALIIGFAADKSSNRIFILQIVLLIGSLGCALTALSFNYSNLFIARAITGVSLAGGLPLINSVITDMAGSDRITILSSYLALSMNFGVISGQTLAGFLGPVYGWRLPFVIVSIIMTIVAFAAGKILKDPSRNLDESTKEKLPFSLKKNFHITCNHLSRIFRIPTLWLVMLQGIPGCIPWSVIIAFLPDYLHMDSNFSVQQATIVMNALSIGGCFGTYLGGILGQKLFNKSKRLPPLFMLVCGIIGIFPMFYLIMYTPSSLSNCILLAFFGGCFANVTGPNIRSTLTNVTHNHQRGTAFASYTLFDDLGKGIGPIFIAKLVENYGRTKAFAASMFFWIPCAILCGLTGFTVNRDFVLK